MVGRDYTGGDLFVWVLQLSVELLWATGAIERERERVGDGVSHPDH